MARREVPLPGVHPLPNGGFEVLVNLGKDATGQRRQRRRRFATLAHANNWKRDQLRARDAGTRTDDAGMTVQSLCTRWLDLPTDRRTAATIITYRQALTGHVYPVLGSTRLDRLTTWDLQRHFDGLRTAGRGLTIIRMAHKALSGACQQAVAWGLIERNPCRGVILPVPVPEPAVALSVTQARALLAAARSDPVCGVLVALMLLTGLRVGEACALGWSDVDLDAGLVRVRRRVTKDADNHPVILEGAKSKSGRRAVKLSPETVALLRRQRATQNEWRLAMGATWADLDLVFTQPDGRGVHRNVVGRAIERLAEAAGLERLTPHDCRHTHTTLAGEIAGRTELLALQQRLGHGSISQTLDYMHPDVSGQAGLAERLDERLRGDEAVGS